MASWPRPVPLFVHRCSRDDTTRYVDTLRRHLPPQAFERIEGRARAGCGVTVSYYPTAPIRVDDFRVLADTSPGLRVAVAEGEDTIAAWCRLFARLLHLGLMLFRPMEHRQGLLYRPRERLYRRRILRPADAGAVRVDS